jgi:hypothetical protein
LEVAGQCGQKAKWFAWKYPVLVVFGILRINRQPMFLKERQGVGHWIVAQRFESKLAALIEEEPPGSLLSVCLQTPESDCTTEVTPGRNWRRITNRTQPLDLVGLSDVFLYERVHRWDNNFTLLGQQARSAAKAFRQQPSPLNSNST